MRPIKFRAYNKSTTKWDYFTLDNISTYVQTFNLHLIEGDEFYLFTGLLDKNGKEIWEGDIYKTINNEIGKVVFSIGAFWVEYFWPHNWDPMCPAELIHGDGEVIGNIHENPDLLK
jgi:hypothetical protein